MTKSVLVTGGAKGIGEAIVTRLVCENYHVIFTFNRSSSSAEELTNSLRKSRPDANVGFLHCDFSSEESVDQLCRKIEALETEFYGFVHNAGVSYDQLSALVELDKAKKLMQINFWSFVQLYKVLVRPMTKQRDGRIICIGSIAAECGSKGNSIYGSSKSALKSFNRSIAQEVARKKVTVNTISPGFIDTDMVAGYRDNKDKIFDSIPCGRYGKPKEVASLVSYLLSEEAEYINGCTIAIDGGLSSGVNY